MIGNCLNICTSCGWNIDSISQFQHISREKFVKEESTE